MQGQLPTNGWSIEKFLFRLAAHALELRQARFRSQGQVTTLPSPDLLLFS